MVADAAVVLRQGDGDAGIGLEGEAEVVVPELDQALAQLRLGGGLAQQGHQGELEPRAVAFGGRGAPGGALVGQVPALRLALPQGDGWAPLIGELLARAGGVADRDEQPVDAGFERGFDRGQRELVVEPAGQAPAGQGRGLARAGAVGGAGEQAVGLPGVQGNRAAIGHVRCPISASGRG